MEEKQTESNDKNDETQKISKKLLVHFGGVAVGLFGIVIALCVFVLFSMGILILNSKNGVDPAILTVFLVASFFLILCIVASKSLIKNSPKGSEQKRSKLFYESLYKGGKRLIAICVFWVILISVGYWFIEPIGGLNYGYTPPSVGEKIVTALTLSSIFLFGIVIGKITTSIAKSRLKGIGYSEEAKIESIEEVHDGAKSENAEVEQSKVKKDLPPMLNADYNVTETPAGNSSTVSSEEPTEKQDLLTKT